MKVTRERLLEVLGTISDPELGSDLVSLGMVEGADVAGDHVNVRIALTDPNSGAAALRERVSGAVAGELGGAEVNVEFVPAVAGPPKQPLPGVRCVIAVGSGKGGVGKSTVAANLAAALAREGAAVGMLDADIYGPSQSKMFGVEGKRLMADDDKRILPLRNHGVRVISIANLVEDGQALTWRGPILHGTLTQLLNQTTWGELDYLIVDLPPGTGDVQLSLVQLVPVSGIVLVSTPQDMAMVDVRRAYTMARKTHIPVLGVVENMSYYQLPDGTKDHIFGEGGAEKWAEAESLPLLGKVPITRALRESGDGGTPLVILEPGNPSALALRRAARLMQAQVRLQSLSSLPML